VLLGAAICAILGGPVAVAHADDNTLRATLNSYSLKIKRDEQAIGRGLNEYHYQGKWRPLVEAYNHEVPDLRALRWKLIMEHASTATGATARHDLAKGLRLIASAYAALSHIVQVAQDGPLPPLQTHAALRTGKRGQKLFKTGFDLLRSTS
jgi:hypothetical protein